MSSPIIRRCRSHASVRWSALAGSARSYGGPSMESCRESLALMRAIDQQFMVTTRGMAHGKWPGIFAPMGMRRSQARPPADGAHGACR